MRCQLYVWFVDAKSYWGCMLPFLRKDLGPVIAQGKWRHERAGAKGIERQISIREMRNVTIYAHVLIFFTGPSQSHVDKMQPERNQSEGRLGSDLCGLHDIREVLSPLSLWLGACGNPPVRRFCFHSPVATLGKGALKPGRSLLWGRERGETEYCQNTPEYSAVFCRRSACSQGLQVFQRLNRKNFFFRFLFIFQN